MENINPLQEAVEKAGGQVALARLIKVNQSTIWTWLVRRDGKAAPEHCIAIEKATGVSRYRLRADVFGPAPVKKPRKAA